MENFPVSYDGIVSANQIKLSLSEEIYNINYNYIENEKNKLLKECGCNNIKEYFEKVKRILKDDKYSNALLNGIEKIDNFVYKDIFMLKISVNNEYITIMSNFQKLLSMLLLNKNIMNIGFYLPCFLDNRSRQYYATLLSPTFYKIFRYLYVFYIKKDFCNLENSIFYQKIIVYIYIVKEFNLSEKKYYMLIILLIEIGKFFITAEKSCFVKTEDLIKTGLENYRNKNN